MALNGSFSASIVSGHYKLRVDWSATQNVANNFSRVTAVMYLVNDWRLSIGARTDNTTNIAGTSTTWSSPAINGTGTTKLGTVTSGNLVHNADGTGKVFISATFYVRATLSGTYYEKITASETVTLDTIPRATTPTLSSTSVDMGSNVTISLPRASNSFTHDLAYSFAGGSYVNIATGVAASKTWAVADVASKIPNATSGTMTIRCITKNGTTTIGTKTVTLTAKVPASVVPTVSSVTHTEAVSGLAARFGAYVQNKSKVTVAVAGAGAKGSTIAAYQATLLGTTYTDASWTSGLLTSSGTVALNARVKDSRGRWSDYKTVNLTVLDYSAPKITAFKVQRCNEAMTPQDNGTNAMLTLAYAVSPLNNKNTAAVKLESKISTAPGYDELSDITGAALFDNRTELIAGVTFPTDNQFDMRLTVTDWFGTTTTYVNILPSGAVILDILASGKGIAFGKTADKTGVDFGWSAKGAVLGLWEATAYIPGDYNECLQPGVYSSVSNAYNQTLANRPTDLAGVLRVWSSIGMQQVTGPWSYIMQEYRPYISTEPTYLRTCHTDGTGAWIFYDWSPH